MLLIYLFANLEETVSPNGETQERDEYPKTENGCQDLQTADNMTSDRLFESTDQRASTSEAYNEEKQCPNNRQHSRYESLVHAEIISEENFTLRTAFRPDHRRRNAPNRHNRDQ